MHGRRPRELHRRPSSSRISTRAGRPTANRGLSMIDPEALASARGRGSTRSGSRRTSTPSASGRSARRSTRSRPRGGPTARTTRGRTSPTSRSSTPTTSAAFRRARRHRQRPAATGRAIDPQMDELTIPFLGTGAGDVAVPVPIAARGRARRSRWAPTGPSRPPTRCSRWRWRSRGSADEHRGERPPFLPDERLELDDALAGFTIGQCLGQPPRGRPRLDRGRQGRRPRRPRSRPVRPRRRAPSARRGSSRRSSTASPSTRRPRSRADGRRRRAWTDDDVDSAPDVGVAARPRGAMLLCATELIRGSGKERPSERRRVMYVNQPSRRACGPRPSATGRPRWSRKRSLRSAHRLRHRKPQDRPRAATPDPVVPSLKNYPYGG